jgi:SAM-dependent methyltransferase
VPSYSEHIPNDNLFSRARNLYKSKGIIHFIHSCFWYLVDMSFTATYYNKFRSSETFLFQGKKYHYIFHRYCTTWKNERCAILPIAFDIIKEYQNRGKNVLEIGNVTSHLYPIVHDVVDKYEIADGVINEDVVNFQPPRRYDLIFSIVTMQHVGLHESPQDATKILKAMENLKKILSPDGIILIIHGLGENKEMDELLKNGQLVFNERFYLKKVSKYKWIEAKWDDVKDLPYDYSVPTATAVLIGLCVKNTAKRVLTNE